MLKRVNFFSDEGRLFTAVSIHFPLASPLITVAFGVYKSWPSELVKNTL